MDASAVWNILPAPYAKKALKADVNKDGVLSKAELDNSSLSLDAKVSYQDVCALSSKGGSQIGPQDLKLALAEKKVATKVGTAEPSAVPPQVKMPTSRRDWNRFAAQQVYFDPGESYEVKSGSLLGVQPQGGIGAATQALDRVKTDSQGEASIKEWWDALRSVANKGQDHDDLFEMEDAPFDAMLGTQDGRVDAADRITRREFALRLRAARLRFAQGGFNRFRKRKKVLIIPARMTSFVRSNKEVFRRFIEMADSILSQDPYKDLKELGSYDELKYRLAVQLLADKFVEATNNDSLLAVQLKQSRLARGRFKKALLAYGASVKSKKGAGSTPTPAQIEVWKNDLPQFERWAAANKLSLKGIDTSKVSDKTWQQFVEFAKVVSPNVLSQGLDKALAFVGLKKGNPQQKLIAKAKALLAKMRAETRADARSNGTAEPAVN